MVVFLEYVFTKNTFAMATTNVLPARTRRTVPRNESAWSPVRVSNSALKPMRDWRSVPVDLAMSWTKTKSSKYTIVYGIADMILK